MFILYIAILCFFFIDYFINHLDLSLKLLDQFLKELDPFIQLIGIKSINFCIKFVEFLETNNISISEDLKYDLYYEPSKYIVTWLSYFQIFWEYHFDILLYISINSR